jgi:hypothetical protein
MHQRFLIGINLLLCLFLSLPSIQAQRKDKKDGDNSFTSKLWYGGGLQLGGGSFGGSNVFTFGVSPMVGYKILPFLSVGPRASFAISSIKEPGFKATSLYNVELGAFLRVKAFRGFFLQGELSNEWVQNPIGFGEKENLTRFNQYVGVGYNFGNGGWGQEIGIFYNFAIANDINSFQNPIGYRIAFTNRF